MIFLTDKLPHMLDIAFIKKRRETMGLSQTECATALQWSRQAWHRIENGDEKDPAIMRCVRIADLLHCTLDELVKRKSTKMVKLPKDRK